MKGLFHDQRSVVRVERKEWNALEGQVEHGCRPRRCLQHWELVVVRVEDVTVLVTIQIDTIVNELARKAAHNKTGRARDGHSTAKVQKIARVLT